MHLQEAGIQPMDKLRLALVYLLTTTALPSDAEFERLERTIEGDVGDSLSALRYTLYPSRMLIYACVEP